MTEYDKKTREFTVYLETLGYSQASINQLPACVRDFLETHANIELSDITADHLKNFHKYLQQRPNKRRSGGLSQSRIVHYLYALRLFFNYLEKIDQIKENPMSQLNFPSPSGNSREILTQDEIKQLFETCTTQRETAILHLFYSCGLRRKEAVQLNIKDIHFRDKLLYIREGKGYKRRVIPLTKKVKEDLWNYFIEGRSFYIKIGSPPDAFMLNNWGLRMQGLGYNKIIKQLFKKVNSTKEITLHSLRHSIATHLLENGVKVEYVRDFLGHAFLETTQIYTKVSNKQLQELTSNTHQS